VEQITTRRREGRIAGRKDRKEGAKERNNGRAGGTKEERKGTKEDGTEEGGRK
jgi:hypothetical protein